MHSSPCSTYRLCSWPRNTVQPKLQQRIDSVGVHPNAFFAPSRVVLPDWLQKAHVCLSFRDACALLSQEQESLTSCRGSMCTPADGAHAPLQPVRQDSQSGYGSRLCAPWTSPSGGCQKAWVHSYLWPALPLVPMAQAIWC